MQIGRPLNDTCNHHHPGRRGQLGGPRVSQLAGCFFDTFGLAPWSSGDPHAIPGPLLGPTGMPIIDPPAHTGGSSAWRHREQARKRAARARKGGGEALHSGGGTSTAAAAGVVASRSVGEIRPRGRRKLPPPAPPPSPLPGWSSRDSACACTRSPCLKGPGVRRARARATHPRWSPRVRRSGVSRARWRPEGGGLA